MSKLYPKEGGMPGEGGMPEGMPEGMPGQGGMPEGPTLDEVD
jgi:hypothetical protein